MNGTDCGRGKGFVLTTIKATAGAKSNNYENTGRRYGIKEWGVHEEI